MVASISHYRLAWHPVEKRGEVLFVAGGTLPVRIPVSCADEFNAMALMLKEPNVVWDGRALWSNSGGKTFGEPPQLDLLDLHAINPNAKKIIDICEDEWPANKGDCSGFVKDVAAKFGVNITGQANDIVDQIRSAGWTTLDGGKAAKNAADEGKFVIGGLRGDEQEAPSVHGHVVVVVSGPLAKDLYPTAYWGTLGSTGERAKTINWAWKAADRDKVFFGAVSI